MRSSNSAIVHQLNQYQQSNQSHMPNQTQKIKSTGLLLWIVITGAGILQAQPLDTLLRQLEERNPALQSTYSRAAAVAETEQQVGRWPDPQAQLGGFILPTETRVGPQWVRLGLTQRLPWKGELEAQRELARQRARTEYVGAQARERELDYQLKLRYYDLYELRARQRLLRQNLAPYRALEQLATRKVAAGQGNTADVLRIRLRRQDLEQRLRILENREAQPLAGINRLLDRPVDVAVAVPDSLPPAEVPNTYERADSLNRHPELRRLREAQEVSQRAIALNQMNRKPDISVGLDYIIVGNRQDADPPDNGQNVLAPRVAVTVPLAQQQYAARDREEQLKIRALEQEYRDLTNHFRATLAEQAAVIREADLEVALYQQQIATTRTAIRLLRTQYSSENIGLDELLELRLELTNYELQQLQAVVKGYRARAAMDQLLINQ